MISFGRLDVQWSTLTKEGRLVKVKNTVKPIASIYSSKVAYLKKIASSYFPKAIHLSQFSRIQINDKPLEFPGSMHSFGNETNRNPALYPTILVKLYGLSSV